jgi:hypothetical protein
MVSRRSFAGNRSSSLSHDIGSGRPSFTVATGMLRAARPPARSSRRKVIQHVYFHEPPIREVGAPRRPDGRPSVCSRVELSLEQAASTSGAIRETSRPLVVMAFHRSFSSSAPLLPFEATFAPGLPSWPVAKELPHDRLNSDWRMNSCLTNVGRGAKPMKLRGGTGMRDTASPLLRVGCSLTPAHQMYAVGAIQ